MPPLLRKASTVSGRTLVLRNATPEDAAFILALRLDPARNQHISATSSRFEDQVAWLRAYETACDQAYFIVCDRSGTALGCVRLYDPAGSSYSWGSWLMVRGLSPIVSIETNLLVYAYGRWLGFGDARLEIRRDNEAVWKFHERFAGATRVRETDQDYFYVVRAEHIADLLNKYRHLVPEPLPVVL